MTGIWSGKSWREFVQKKMKLEMGSEEQIRAKQKRQRWKILKMGNMNINESLKQEITKEKDFNYR